VIFLVRKTKRKRKIRNYKEKEYSFFSPTVLKIVLFIIFAIYLAFLNTTTLPDSFLYNIVSALIGWPVLIIKNYFGLILGFIWVYVFSCVLDYLKRIVKR